MSATHTDLPGAAETDWQCRDDAKHMSTIASQDTVLTVQWVAIVVVALRHTHAKLMQHTNRMDIAFAGSSAHSIGAEAFGDMAAFSSQKGCCHCVRTLKSVLQGGALPPVGAVWIGLGSQKKVDHLVMPFGSRQVQG